jgi:pimeloyl-ACP methyl ester carboxylesterase
MHPFQRIRFAIKSLLVILALTNATIAWAQQLPSLSTAPHYQDQYLITDSVRLHYVDSGAGTPIVLLHGNDGSLQDFTMSIFDRLTTKYRTLAFDRPGHGESQSPSDIVATPEIQARILHNALQQLKIERPLLVAHSWSGSGALSYCLQFPNDLCGIVLLGGMAYETRQAAPCPIYYALDVPLVGTGLALWFKAVGRSTIEKQLQVAFAPDIAPKPYIKKFLSSLFRLSQLRAAARDEITLNPALRRMSSQYGNIHVPVVIVTGDCDKTVPPQNHSYPLHWTIPQSRLIVIKDAGHELQFNRSQEVIQAIDLAVDTAASSTKS